MSESARKESIRHLLRARGVATVGQMCKALGVSHVTLMDTLAAMRDVEAIRGSGEAEEWRFKKGQNAPPGGEIVTARMPRGPR